MGTRVCYKHGIYLLTSCPKCATPLGDTRSLLKASINCRCTIALPTLRCNVTENDPWWHLATFEHHCLNAGKGVLSSPGLVGYLREQLKEKFPSGGRFAGRRALESTFGTDGAAWLQRDIRSQITAVRTGGLTAFSLTQARAPTYAALFVACGIAFDKACLEVWSSSQELNHQSKPKRIRNAPPTTVHEAREHFMQFVSRGGAKRWKELRSTRPHLYWFLTFEDPDWLASQMPPRTQSHRSAAPSIDSDRKLLTSIESLATASKLGPRVRHAAIRASYRDKAWLDSNIDASRKRGMEYTREVLIECLQQVRIDHLNRTLKPKRFTRREAARGLGTTIKTLLSRAEKFDVPLELIDEDLSKFRFRALNWAVEQRLAKGLSLAPSMVRQLAGLGEVVSLTAVTDAIKRIKLELSNRCDEGNPSWEQKQDN